MPKETPLELGFLTASCSPQDGVAPRPPAAPAPPPLLATRVQEREREFYVKPPPKHDFPRFSGDNLRLWMDLAFDIF